MISRIRGILIERLSTEIVIECNGVGFSLLVSVNTSEKLPAIGEEAKLFTYFHFREDMVQLFGFSTETEREAFKMLISISGIGPKIAISILSSITATELREHILRNNAFALTKLPGIGKKTAERILLELKEKIIKLEPFSGAQKPDDKLFLIRQEAIGALQTLGYNRLSAERAVGLAIKELKSDITTAEQIIKSALRHAVI
ncbi:MAG: Holliday junction helicase RuvA [Ignavibacteria bacterium]|nr:Holliday junction helicase RuvA [Ignavibacteria bacterium]